MSSIIQKCKGCGKEFELSSGEIEFFNSRGLSQPKRCKKCRAKKREGKEQRLTLKDGIERG